MTWRWIHIFWLQTLAFGVNLGTCLGFMHTSSTGGGVPHILYALFFMVFAMWWAKMAGNSWRKRSERVQ